MSINQMMRGYDYYKQKYQNIKPIRGRAVECRPLGKRSRDWETIEKSAEGEVYSAKLYRTECVRYHPNGDIQIVCGSWGTPITADFIHTHSPFYSYKKYNKIWVQVVNNKGGENRLYPIPETEEGLTFKYVGEGEAFTYEPTSAVVVEQTVVDRTKAKDARKPMKPFLDWARMINKLSDGWVMNETREQFGTFKSNGWRGEYDYGVSVDVAEFEWHGAIKFKPEGAYKYLSECPPDDYMKIYLMIMNGSSGATSKRLAKTIKNPNPQYQGHDIELFDYQFDYEYLKRSVYRMVEQAVDTKKKVSVEIGSKAITNVAG
jgi:hypothetical protein